MHYRVCPVVCYPALIASCCIFSFGYVEFDSVETAQSAMASMDGQELDGRYLRLDFAEPRGSTPGSGGGRGGFRGGRGGDRGGGRGGFRGGRGGGRGTLRRDYFVQSTG